MWSGQPCDEPETPSACAPEAHVPGQDRGQADQQRQAAVLSAQVDGESHPEQGSANLRLKYKLKKASGGRGRAEVAGGRGRRTTTTA